MSTAPYIPSLGAVESSLAISIVDRFFKMRPRGPVQDAVVEGSESASRADLESFVPSPVLAVYPPVSAGDFAPLFLDRGFRTRPRAAVAADLVAFERVSPQSLQSPALASCKPSLPASMIGEYAPVFVDRGFRARPRGPVQSQGLAQFENAFLADPAVLISPPALARLRPDAIGECSPNSVRRFYRVGPKGPAVFLALAAHEAINEGVLEPLLSSPVLAGLQGSILGELSPLRIERFFRARPRGPVETVVPAGLERIETGGSAELVSAPATGTLPGYLIGECAPSPVVRFFRARARGPVEAGTLAGMERIETGVSAELVSAPATGTLPGYLMGECAPGPVVRFFRARPRGPVESGTLLEIEQIATGASADLISKPVTATMPAHVVGECVPAPMVRFFRARLRGPLDTPSISACEDIATGPHAVLVSKAATGTLPTDVIGECTPNSVVRFFRARPRGPVEASLPAMEQIAAGQAAGFVSKPVTGTLPAEVIGECAPDSIVRFFRARPRGPVSGPVMAMTGDGECTLIDSNAKLSMAVLPRIVVSALQPVFVDRILRMRPRAGVPDRDVRRFDLIDSGLAALLQSAPVLAVLPLSVIGELMPTLWDKAYKMRPRGPVQASGLAGFKPIATGQSITLSGTSIFPELALLGSAFEPTFVDRFYRMRPRNPVQLDVAKFEAVLAGEPEILTSRATLPSMPAVLMRQARMPSTKERGPRMRPPGPRASSGGSNFESIDEGEADTRVPQASMIGLPDGILSDCAPRAAKRFFRMRPGGAFGDAAVASFERIATGTAIAAIANIQVSAHGELAIAGILPVLDAATVSGMSFAPGLSAAMAQWSRPVLHPVVARMPKLGAPYSLIALTAAWQHTPLKSAKLTPVPAPVKCDPVTVRPTFTADVIVDYRPSLIDIRKAFQEAHKPSWFGRIADFWSEATWDLKWATAAVPILLGVFIHYATAESPKSKAMANVDQAAMASNPLPPLKSAVDSRWPSLRNELIGRAAVKLEDNFAAGLSAWSGDGDWSKSWKYDTHGGVKPGALALYTPTTAMSDYQAEFTGEIEKKSLGWVFRAADTRNYYWVKLTALNPGLLPTIAVVRSTVIDGKEGPRTQTLLPFAVGKDQVYRVRMEVSGQFFTLFVQDHVVAFWSDDRLKTGGIGFFSGKGEQSRLEAVRVTHQDDALGRLCASLSLKNKTLKEPGVSINESQK
jgi:hypothetical protein